MNHNRRQIRKKSDTALVWGAAMIFFGLMVLVHKLNILPVQVSKVLFDWPNYFFYAGVLSLCFQRDKWLGLIFITIGGLYQAQHHLLSGILWVDYLWPLIYVVIGTLLLFFYLRK